MLEDTHGGCEILHNMNLESKTISHSLPNPLPPTHTHTTHLSDLSFKRVPVIWCSKNFKLVVPEGATSAGCVEFLRMHSCTYLRFIKGKLNIEI